MNYENTGLHLNTLFNICNTYGVSPKLVESDKQQQIKWDFKINTKHEKHRSSDEFQIVLLYLMQNSENREFIAAIDLFDYLINQNKLNPRIYGGYTQKKQGRERKWEFAFGKTSVEVMVEEKDNQDNKTLKVA